MKTEKARQAEAARVELGTERRCEITHGPCHQSWMQLPPKTRFLKTLHRDPCHPDITLSSGGTPSCLESDLSGEMGFSAPNWALGKVYGRWDANKCSECTCRYFQNISSSYSRCSKYRDTSIQNSLILTEQEKQSDGNIGNFYSGNRICKWKLNRLKTREPTADKEVN